MITVSKPARQRVGLACGALVCTTFLCALASPAAISAQLPPPAISPVTGLPLPTASPVERLGSNRFRIGNVRVDTAKKEIAVDGKVNDVQVLEFVATTKDGLKGYESALELDTNAINFNLALLLIGLDKANAVLPRYHFDPVPPAGDPVEVWVEWTDGRNQRRVRAEQLVYLEETKQTLPEGHWVYTGSAFLPNNNAYWADLDGTLIGFVHTPAPVIENPRPVPGAYGSARPNPNLNLKPGTKVVVTVRALDRKTLK